MKPFAGDRFLHSEIARLCAVHKVESIIETGTLEGATSRAVCLLADKVWTVDIAFHQAACGLPDNVEKRAGDSAKLLPEILKVAPGIVLFFLDAHECNVSTAIRGELEAIAASNRFDSVIVIHDFLVPTRENDLGFDTYPDGPLDLKYISAQIEPFLTRGYCYYFNEQADGDRRGVLFLVPPL